MLEYTPEDEIIIKDRYDDLLRSCENVFKSEQDREMVKKAFLLAKNAHKGVRRRSGEPYVLHPIAVAKIVVEEIGLGTKSITASLLHDVVEDTPYTVADIETMFSPKIASMVDGLTKMAGTFTMEMSKQAENFRKMLLTLSDDIRVILIKIADRLHNMRTMGSMPRDKQIKIASETLFLFAPLAHRLGLYAIKTELEDLSLKFRFPEQYENIKVKLEDSAEGRSDFIEYFIRPIKESLSNSGIDCNISGRVKSVYSVWSKMQRKNISFEEIYDLFAIRIIFKPMDIIPEKSQCWHIYSLITDIYPPNPDRVRDWVNFPKANGYEALHVTVMGKSGVWVEVQIRSERMEDVAERGFAAHWKYKQDHSTEDEFDRWLREIRGALHDNTGNAADFLDNVKLTLYTREIVVFTPKGEARKLPLGATVLDFAYNIHTNIGNKAIGAKVNHRIESIFHVINNGDQIEILTSDNAEPKAEWIDHVITAKAKQSITSYLKHNRDNNIERGMNMFENSMKGYGITPSGRLFRKLLPAYECSNKDEFYSKLGAGIINLDGVDKILHENSMTKMLKFWTLQIGGQKKSKNDNAYIVGGDEDISSDIPKFVIAEDCSPIPGDEIVGYRDPDTNAIVVHKAGCEGLTKLAARHGENITTNISWSSHKAESYLVVIEIRGIDRVGMLVDISQVITVELNINIRELSIRSHDGIFEGKISVYVKDTSSLNDVMRKVEKIKGIEIVKRTL